ncbi:Phosphoadenosine phosphosulfate reductase family protein, partial [Dysosmobacter welbionis]
HAGLPAEGFHFMPDVAAVQGPPGAGAEQGPLLDILRPGIPPQAFRQFLRQQDGPALSLQPDLRPASTQGLRRDEAQFAHPDTGGADRQHHVVQPLVLAPLGNREQPAVLRLRQVPLLLPKRPPLNLQQLHLAVLRSTEPQIRVHSRELVVDRQSPVLLLQALPVCQNTRLGHRGAAQSQSQLFRLLHVFFH